jgi:hypothetical protein
MSTAPQPDDVRQLVIRMFGEWGNGLPSDGELSETILIDQGKCVARSYRLQDFLAMWLLETGILQFYDPTGNMLRTVNLGEKLVPQREAA